MLDSKEWYAWVIKRSKFDQAIKYIREEVPEIDKFFYPMVKRGPEELSPKSKVKDVPLYEGYLFLHYDQHPEVFQKLKRFPFITTFVGKISEKEISQMEGVQGKLLSEIMSQKFSEGDSVRVLSGPFRGFLAEVVSVNSGLIKVRVEAKILGQQEIELVFKNSDLERKISTSREGVQEIQ